MTIWVVSLSLLAGSLLAYGLAILAAFTMTNDLPRNMIVFLLLIIGGMLLLACVVVVIVAAVRTGLA